MKDTDIPRVWAQALLELAGDRKKDRAVVEGVKVLKDLFDALPELTLLLASPRVPAEVKKSGLARALKGALPPLLVDFLGLLVDRARAMFLPEILEAFVDLHHEAEGVVVAHVRSAAPLPDALKKRVEKTMRDISKLKVELDVREDPSLLGGMVVQMKDTRFDGSLKRALRELKDRMAKVRMESEVVYADSNG